VGRIPFLLRNRSLKEMQHSKAPQDTRKHIQRKTMKKHNYQTRHLIYTERKFTGAGGDEPSLLQLITPLAHVISGLQGGWHNPSCWQIEGLLQLFTLNNVA